MATRLHLPLNEYIPGTGVIPNCGAAGAHAFRMGNAGITTSISKFGAGCLAGAASSGLLFTNLGSSLSDFTIEFWIYPTSTAQMLVVSSSTPWYIQVSGRAVSFYHNTGSWLSIGHQTLLTLNTWAHVAAVRVSGSVKLYIDGVASTGTLTDAVAIGLGTVGVGSQYTAGFNLVGYMDDVRISDTALYTAGFTPPDAIPYDLPEAPFCGLLDSTTYLSAFAMPATRIVKADALAAASDIYYGGDGRIVGTTKNTPALLVSRRVRLHERNSGHLVREGWSDAAGNYSFTHLSRDYTYYVVGFDHTDQYQGVVADKLVPEAM